MPVHIGFIASIGSQNMDVLPRMKAALATDGIMAVLAGEPTTPIAKGA